MEEQKSKTSQLAVVKKPQEKWDPDPQPLPEEKDLKPAELKDLGKKLCAEKKWLDAYRVYTTLLYIKEASDEDKSIGLSNRSLVLYSMERYEDAKNDGLRCVKLRPKWAKGYLRAGNAFLALTEISKAVAYFKGGVGKEGDDGSMKTKVNELYLDMNAPNLVPKNNYYYQELQDFKKNYFSNSEKADEIYDKLMEKRSDVYNTTELDKVLDEINQIILRTWNFLNTADMFVKEEKFFLANCCCKLEMDLKDRNNKKEMMDKMKRNNEKEEKVHAHRLINTLALNVDTNREYSIDLREVVNFFHTNVINNYYDKNPVFYNYFLTEVRNAEANWFLDRNLDLKNTPETFYKGPNPKKGIDYYWKFYTMNAGSFFNGALANIIDDLTRTGIQPYFMYQNPETKQNEQVNVIMAGIMDAVVVKKFINPTIYYKEKDGYFKMIKGKTMGKAFLSADCAQSLICLITDKMVYQKRLYLLVDLTATQYDIFEYNAKGFPYYEKTMLAGDYKVDKNYYVGGCAHKIETYVEPLVKEDKKFQYFPLKTWTDVLTSTHIDVKAKVKCGYGKPPEKSKEQQKEDDN